MRATLEGLAELGHDRLSIEEIAARAGVGKGAVYRRWSSKADLVVDAMLRWRDQTGPVSPPDTGSLLGDLDEMVARVPDYDETITKQMAVLLAIVGAGARDPSLQRVLAESGFARPRQVMLQVLTNAAERGELRPNVDLRLVADIVVGLNLLRLATGEPPDQACVEHILRTVVYPLVATEAVTDPGHQPGG